MLGPFFNKPGSYGVLSIETDTESINKSRYSPKISIDRKFYMGIFMQKN